tara:strand:+ start:1922 stop:2431 length:510 start_codon:yes stop_codon:yes gene_type:complete
MDENKIGGNMSIYQAKNVMTEFNQFGKREAVKDQFAQVSGPGAGLMDVVGGLSAMTGVHGVVTGVQNFFMTPEQRFQKGIDTLAKNAETINNFVDKIPADQLESIRKMYGYDKSNQFAAVRRYLFSLDKSANKIRTDAGLPIPDESFVNIFLQGVENFIPEEYFNAGNL